jgi:hypothetical protein
MAYKFWQEIRSRRIWRSFLRGLRLFVNGLSVTFASATWRESTYSRPYDRALVRGLKLLLLRLFAVLALGAISYAFFGMPAPLFVVFVGGLIIIALDIRYRERVTETYTQWGQIMKQVDLENKRSMEFIDAHRAEIYEFIEHGGTPIDLSPLRPEVRERVSRHMADFHRIYHEVNDRMSRGIYL